MAVELVAEGGVAVPMQDRIAVCIEIVLFERAAVRVFHLFELRETALDHSRLTIDTEIILLGGAPAFIFDAQEARKPYLFSVGLPSTSKNESSF